MHSDLTGGVSARFGANTLALLEAVQAAWPEHENYLRKSFEPRSEAILEVTEVVADFVVRLARGQCRPISVYANDYRYMCEDIFGPEDLFFAREGRYRLSSFEDAVREVYDNAALMGRYMNGLLASYVLWLHHANAIHDFARRQLPATPVGGRHLEIGPGHGMLLHLAVAAGRFSSMTAWDVSETSIAQTREALETFGEANEVELVRQDLFSATGAAARFDFIVLSEILEHLDKPKEALFRVRELLAPGGELWINVPANAPAPDHIFHFTSVEDAADMVRASGFTVVRAEGFPIAGATLERAVRRALPVSCVIAAVKSA